MKAFKIALPACVAVLACLPLAGIPRGSEWTLRGPWFQDQTGRLESASRNLCVRDARSGIVMTTPLSRLSDLTVSGAGPDNSCVSVDFATDDGKYLGGCLTGGLSLRSGSTIFDLSALRDVVSLKRKK